MAVRTFQPAHIFNNPDRRNAEHHAEGNRLSRIKKSNMAGGCYHDQTISIFDHMSNIERFISSSSRKIDNKEIERSPFPFSQKLADSHFLRGKIVYPEQQLPGVPHELGAPQQPPELDSEGPRDGAMTVL